MITAEATGSGMHGCQRKDQKTCVAMHCWQIELVQGSDEGGTAACRCQAFHVLRNPRLRVLCRRAE